MLYDIFPFLCGLLHSVWHSLGPSMFLQMALFHSFWCLSNILLCIVYMCVYIYTHTHIYNTTSSLSIHIWWTFRLFPWLSHCKQCFSEHSVQFSHSVVSDSLWPHGLQHARLPCPSPPPEAYSNSRPSSQWYHPTISSSVIPFSSCLQSFPASGSFPMSQFFASGGQSIGVSASAWVLPVNIQDCFPLGLSGWLSLLSKGLSRVSSNTTIQKHHWGACIFLGHVFLWICAQGGIAGSYDSSIFRLLRNLHTGSP